MLVTDSLDHSKDFACFAPQVPTHFRPKLHSRSWYLNSNRAPVTIIERVNCPQETARTPPDDFHPLRPLSNNRRRFPRQMLAQIIAAPFAENLAE
jgi:hypothetical protein